MPVTVQKADYGPHRWHVKQGERMIVRVSTKRVATAIARLANEPSPTTYASLHALAGADDAVFYAFCLGLGPATCGADSKTGAPIAGNK